MFIGDRIGDHIYALRSKAPFWPDRPALRRHAARKGNGDFQNWITFAGMFPADQPRYVVAIMLDAPTHGQNASMLFHEIASTLAVRDRIPVSTAPNPVQTLIVR